MEPGDALPHGLNLLLLIGDEAWRAAVLQNAGRSTPVAVASAPEDALAQLQRAADPFSHVLVQPATAGDFLPEIAGIVAQMADRTRLVLIGTETAASLGVKATRTASPDALASMIAAEAGVPALPPLAADDIMKAFDAGHMECLFQPIVRLSDGRAVGVEALARLHHPERGMLTPDWFIPQVETAGLSMPLTAAVLRSALGGIDPAFLQRHAMFVTVNLPLDVLLQPDALPMIESHRHAAGIEVGCILIELTESRPVFDIPALGTALTRWTAAGYRLAIDDMGPDMVNQADLFGLPFEMVKLDMAIVMQSRHDPLALRYLQRTIANAQAGGLAIIAEGIEDAALWVQMRDLGVDHAQGFLIGRATPARELPAWLEGWEQRLKETA